MRGGVAVCGTEDPVTAGEEKSAARLGTDPEKVAASSAVASATAGPSMAERITGDEEGATEDPGEAAESGLDPTRTHAPGAVDRSGPRLM